MAHTGKWLTKGWELFLDNAGILILLSLIYWGVWGATDYFAEGLGSLLGFIIMGPFDAAILALLFYQMKSGSLELGRAKDGLKPLGHTLLANFLVTLFVVVGAMFCIVPGIIIGALYLFPIQLIVDKKLSFWSAMEESRKKVQPDLAGFIGFTMVISLIAILVASPGIVLTILKLKLAAAVVTMICQALVYPYILCTAAVAYRDLWPEEETIAALPDTAAS